jgi:CheY-like chemotaxis protein
MPFRVLVVDDDPVMLKFMRTTLESLGCEVFTSRVGGEAISLVDRMKFSAVFLDYSMPHIDGFRVARYIRSSPSNSAVPIVLLTGYGDIETMRASFKVGITFFQPKPPNKEMLRSLLRNMHSAMLSEKQSYTRVPLSVGVSCKRGKHLFQSRSLNISEGGMMLASPGEVGIGKVIELRFALPGSRLTVHAHASVVRLAGENRIAVQFAGLKVDERQAIQDYVAKATRAQT